MPQKQNRQLRDLRFDHDTGIRFRRSSAEVVDASRRCGMHRQVGGELAVDPDFARVRHGEARDRHQQRCFARPGRAEQGQELALGQIKVGFVERDDRP